MQTARVVSFTHAVQNSYIAMDTFNIDSKFDMSMKIKSQEQDGLLAYITDDTANQVSTFVN